MIDDNSSHRIFSVEFNRFTIAVLYLTVPSFLLFCMYVLLSLLNISSQAFNTYDSYTNIPHHKVGLLLGTSPRVSRDQPNLYFTYRIAAAVELFKAGKIDYLLVSGDNRHESYNEPREMRRALLKEGIPDDRIIADYAGISTLDSVVRAKEVFLLTEMTIISQSFHNERALYIAAKNGIRAVGFNAAAPGDWYSKFKIELREILARVKCVFDLQFWYSRPHFLGDPIIIGQGALPKQLSHKSKRMSSKPKRLGNAAQKRINHAGLEP